jgi:hypothetical protein
VRADLTAHRDALAAKKAQGFKLSNRTSLAVAQRRAADAIAANALPIVG